MEKVIFYTTHCPMCRGLETMLKMAAVEYEECSDVELMKSKGLTHAPALELEDGTIMDFSEARKWLNARRKSES